MRVRSFIRSYVRDLSVLVGILTEFVDGARPFVLVCSTDDHLRVERAVLFLAVDVQPQAAGPQP